VNVFLLGKGGVPKKKLGGKKRREWKEGTVGLVPDHKRRSVRKGKKGDPKVWGNKRGVKMKKENYKRLQGRER